MHCRELGETLDADRTGALAREQVAELEEHLRRCPACRDLAGRERAWIELLQDRLGGVDPASEALRARIRTAVDAGAPPWTTRILASGWTPRLAMAAVLALVLVVPLVWLGGGTPARATAAAQRYAAHAPTPNGAVPPCCTPLELGVGDPLAPRVPEVRVPDLAAAGLAFAHAAYCTFGDDPVYSLEYGDRAGGRFSLYIGEHGAREFKLLRHETRDGVSQARHTVAPPAAASGPALRVEVVLWMRGGRLFTWVGPEGPGFEAARRQLQIAP